MNLERKFNTTLWFQILDTSPNFNIWVHPCLATLSYTKGELLLWSVSGVRCPLTFPLNDFFSETTGPGVIWFKFGHKHYWVKGLQIFTNGEAPPP